MQYLVKYTDGVEIVLKLCHVLYLSFIK